jgi:putative tryptophan/tyrosine transport system substrate-binding protein
MRRRDFLALWAGFAAAGASISRAQAPPNMLRVGIISGQPRTAALWVAFDRRLRELGYREGENLMVLFLDSHGDTEHQELTNELMQHKVDIIVAGGGEVALKSLVGLTRTVPIVMLALSYDPFEHGFVETLARPGGNITGVFYQQPELAVKRLDIMRQAFPDLQAATVFWDEQSADQWHAVEHAAAGLRLFGFELRQQPYDYEQALAQSPPEARSVLLMMSSAFLLRDRDRIVDLARRHRMASIFALREYVESGGLISYGPSLSAMLRRVADHVDHIARGARPSDLPIEQPTQFELVINLKTAKALGLTLPPLFLARADEVIE